METKQKITKLELAQAALKYAKEVQSNPYSPMATIALNALEETARDYARPIFLSVMRDR